MDLGVSLSIAWRQPVILNSVVLLLLLLTLPMPCTISMTTPSWKPKLRWLGLLHVPIEHTKAELDRSRTTRDPTARSFGRPQTTTTTTTTVSTVMPKLPITTIYALWRTIPMTKDPQRSMPVLLACIPASPPGCGTGRNTTDGWEKAWSRCDARAG